MADEITPEDVVANATGAKSFTGDGQTVVAFDPANQIEAAKFAAAQKAKRKGGISFMRFVPPNARGENC